MNDVDNALAGLYWNSDVAMKVKARMKSVLPVSAVMVEMHDAPARHTTL